VFPAPGVGDGTAEGLVKGVGSDSERSTGPSSGEGSGFTTASGARTEFSVPGVAAGLGDVAGRMTTRGVAAAPGEGELSADAGADSVEGVVFSRFADRLT
jgi:hypothetical protein